MPLRCCKLPYLLSGNPCKYKQTPEKSNQVISFHFITPTKWQNNIGLIYGPVLFQHTKRLRVRRSLV